MPNEPNQPENPQSPKKPSKLPPDPVFPPGSYADRLVNYWKTYRPKDYQYMLEEGLAEESFRGQGERAEELESSLIRDGLAHDQVSEIVTDQVFPMSEEEQPNLLEPPDYGVDDRTLLEQEEDYLAAQLKKQAEEKSEQKPAPPPEATM